MDAQEVRQQRVAEFKVAPAGNFPREEIQHVPELIRLGVGHRRDVPRTERPNLRV